MGWVSDFQISNFRLRRASTRAARLDRAARNGMDVLLAHLWGRGRACSASRAGSNRRRACARPARAPPPASGAPERPRRFCLSELASLLSRHRGPRRRSLRTEWRSGLSGNGARTTCLPVQTNKRGIDRAPVAAGRSRRGPVPARVTTDVPAELPGQHPHPKGERTIGPLWPNDATRAARGAKREGQEPLGSSAPHPLVVGIRSLSSAKRRVRRKLTIPRY